jgi:predicted DNA-binding protein (UPF0278 family)
VVVFDTVNNPGRMEFVINPDVRDKIKKEVSAYIPYEEMQPSALDKVVSWIVKKLPESD